MTTNLETMKVNVTTVASIVIASFMLYFFINDMKDQVLIDAKIYTIGVDIDRLEDVVEMYQFQIDNNLAKPDAVGRVAGLRAKIARREKEKSDLLL